jgi:ankyrin repeat protein
MLLAVDAIQVNQAANNEWTPLMTAVNSSHIDTVIQLLQHGIGHTIVWFCINKIKPSGRIALYKYALLLPQQHQPLLDFHSCLLSAKNALVPTSALKVFKTIWPPLVAFTIESFLLPSKKTRRTMQHVISRFNATLNDHNEKKETQLYNAVRSAEVESVRFLLLQEGILINKKSRSVITREGAADRIRWCTPLYRAEKRVTWAATNGSLSDDEVSRRNQVAVLLRDAGAHA